MGMQTDNAPLDGRTSTAQLIDRINRDLDRLQRDVHELAHRLDAMMPGADDRLHYEHHVDITEATVERRRLWSNIRSQAMGGVMMAIGGGMIALVVYAVAQYVRTGGA